MSGSATDLTDHVVSLTASRVVIVAGKGGVGKTTVTAVLARAAARRGLRVLVVELDGKPTLADLVADAAPAVELEAISAPDALDEYLRDHGFGRIAKRLSVTGVIDVVGTAAPGIDDIVVLGKVKQLERAGTWDLIVVDGPAAGHAITFLTAARGLLDAVRGGPVRAQAADVLELLGDPARCQVVLVTIPETTPVNEVIETAFALEDQVGVQLGPVVVNGVDLGVELPDPDDPEVIEGLGEAGVPDDDVDVLLAAARYRRSRRAMERAEIERLAAELPLAQVHLPAMSVAGLSADDVAALAADLDGSGAAGSGAAGSDPTSGGEPT
jgi:arsenite/tail-anchored protein-transporting ATPase